MDIRNMYFEFFPRISILVVLICGVLVNNASSIDVENLKIGCFPESPANREFRVSPGNYRPWSLTPYDCVRLCGDLKYPLSALQNGNLCFCASFFNSSRQQSSNCTIDCTGDSSYNCGGTWENLVYNSSSFKDELVINYSSSLTVFKWINLSAVFVNRSSPALRVAFNIGDGNGESLGENAEFRFRAVYWGKIIVKAQVLNAFSVGFVQRDIFVKAFPGRAELNCPSTVRTEDTFHCTAKIYEGTTLAATWMFQNGSERNISLPSPLYVRAGSPIPQWEVQNLASSYGSGVFLLPSSQFSSEARLLALEIYGQTAGQIKVFVVRPVCNSPTSFYCLVNQSCTSQPCTSQFIHQCVSPSTLCVSSASCTSSPGGNCSQSSKSTTRRASHFRITADLGVLTITTGYNLIVLPENQTFDVSPGDMIAWGPVTDGKVAHKPGENTVYNFSSVNAKTLQNGADIYKNQSTEISDLDYMINIVGSQASIFELDHQFNQSGVYWARVTFKDALGNTLAPITRQILAQTPLVEIKIVYPSGFPFYGVRTNRNMTMTVEIPTDSNVNVSWTLLNTSTLLKRQELQNAGQSSLRVPLNITFSSLGTHVILVEAENMISSVNATIFVNVQDSISSLNASIISAPVYLGAQSKLISFAIGTNVRYKWNFGDGAVTSYISNTTVHHRFARTGTINVSVIAYNLAFKRTTWFQVQVLHPLTIFVPKQSFVGLKLNASCSLVGPFESDQYYYWNFGDGVTEEGTNKTKVFHNYTKGGTYLVSVKLRNEVLVNASSEILVIEPVSGLTLDNFTGVELYDNHTFVANTTKGNNLTYEWFLHSNNSITIMICTSNSIEFHFNQTGFYTISVNVSNAISSAFASFSFSVQRRIEGLGITAFPNPAPSNSTITFNLTKGSGTNVKYRLDFGDGFVLREFPESFLFNRTFLSGQWQVIFTGENAVNHVIVFYNVTVQDPVKNITVGVQPAALFHGRELVAVGEETHLFSNVTEGTDVYFLWDFNDSSSSYPHKGSLLPTGGSNHTITHSFPNKGPFNVTVKAYNVISRLWSWIFVYAQQRIEGFTLTVTDPASPGDEITFRFSQIKGDNVSYIINYGDNSTSQVVTTDKVLKTYNNTGVYNVTVKAVNQISSDTAVKTITIQQKIQGLDFISTINPVEIGSPTVISWKIAAGSDVKYVLDYSDGSALQVLNANVVGMNVTIHHNYTFAGEFTVKITAYNLVGPNNTIQAKAVVDESIVGLVAYAQNSSVIMYENVVILTSILKGSRVEYEYNFGDGSALVTTKNNTAHTYRKSGAFNVSVTARNGLGMATVYLNSTVEVGKPRAPLQIRGLNVSCQATTPENASEIRVTFEYGYLFQCEVDFGDNSEQNYSDSNLPSLLLHIYSSVGSFEVIVKCQNELGSDIAQTIAFVDEVITGLKFKSGNGVIHKEFGQSVDVEWIWATGTNINLSVVLHGHGPIESHRTSSTSEFIRLGNTLCPSPGNYTIDITLSNSVTSPKALTAVIMFTERISELSLSFNPVARTGFPVPFFVTVSSGLDVKILWDYGDGRDSESHNRGFGKQKFISSHSYMLQGTYTVVVFTSNYNSGENATDNVTIMDPVQGFSFHQNNTLIWPSRKVEFRFVRNSSSFDLLGAKYEIDFGNGKVSRERTIDPKETNFTYSFSYPEPGCYQAKLIIWNLVSRVELTAPVKIMEHITNASLRAMHSEYSAHPGAAGGGPTGNTFPFEYPVSFSITQDTGTCLKYDWNYGDYGELREVAKAVTTHRYPLRGTYNVTAKVYNSLGTKYLHRTITLQHSVIGLYLVVSGPGKPGNNITFVVFCASLGTDSKFVFNAGNGSQNVTLYRKGFTNNTQLKAERLIDQRIILPFNPSLYYARVVNHVYLDEGQFNAQVWAWNEASNQRAGASVLVANENVPIPIVKVIGGTNSPTNDAALSYGRQFTLTSQVTIQSEKLFVAAFSWVVYKADTYNLNLSSPHLQLPPESGREVGLPPDVLTNQSSLVIPAFGLLPGEYIFRLKVTIIDPEIDNADFTFIKIAGANIEASIAGGHLRSHDWGQRLLLDASESHDPLSQGNENLIFVWFCKITKTIAGIKNSGLGCFGNGDGQVEYTGITFAVEAKQLFESTTYEFTVNVSSVKTGRWSTANQLVIVLTGNPPDIKMRCVSNCGKYLDPSRRLHLSTECLDCVTDQPLTYSWSVMNGNASAPFAVWPERALTPLNSPEALILAGTFNNSSEYRIKVTVSRPNSASQGIAEYIILTNTPPQGGTCDVTPRAGRELDTRFNFSCRNWQDEHQPLTYEMFITHPADGKVPGSPRNGELVFFGPSLQGQEVLLPVGKNEVRYFINVVVLIKDAFGEFSKITLPVQVKPRNVTQKEITDKTLKEDNQLEKEIGRGALQEVVQIIHVISDILNSHDGDDVFEEEIKKEVRSAMVGYLAEIRPQTLNDVSIVSRSLNSATAVPSETEVETQVQATKQHTKMVALLTKESQAEEDGGIIENTAGEILEGLSNTLLASTKSSAESLNETTKNVTEEVTFKVLQLVDDVSDAVLRPMTLSQKPLVINTRSVAVGLSKRKPDNLAGIALNAGGESQFVLPHKVSLVNETTNSYVTTTVTELSANPFQSSGNFTLVKSNPLSLVLKGSDGEAIPVEGLTSPIDILLPRKESLQVALNISQTPSSDGSMTFHKVSVPNNDSVIIAKVLPQDKRSKFTLYIRYNEQPSPTNYDFKTSLPFEDSTLDNYTMFVLQEQMKGKGDYYIGVLPIAYDREAVKTVVNYTFDVICSACYFWDEEVKEWSTKGCQVSNKTNRDLTYCQCSHLTWFGADLFIPPNKLDIKDSFKKLANIHKHPALLATFCTIICLYVVGLVWARRKDRRDVDKVGLVPVLDNNPADRYRYEVTVHTARGKDTGTTANVSILVAGEDGQSAVHMLKSTSRSCLYPGGVDSFLITTPECLGSLTYIRIWHDNTGKSPSWLLSQVVIRDIDTEEKFFFLCNQWLACDQGDGQVDRLLPVAGKDELRDFMHLFKAKTSRDFSDGHLWFSIAFRPVRSRFTCVQRVSCCLSLLLCSMLVNVMWYRTPMKQQNSVIIDLGFFEFTWHEILIGIQSSLIVFPINLLIVQLFRNRGVSPKTKKKYVERTRTEFSPPTQNPRKQTAVSLSDITPTAPQMGSEDRRQRNVQLKNLTSIRSPVTVRQDSWDDELFCTLLETQISYSKKEMQNKGEKAKKEKMPIKNDHEGEVPDYLSSDIYYYLYKDEAINYNRVRPESIGSNESVNTTTALVPLEKPKKKRKLKMKCLFPWWFVYIGWFLCLSTATVAGFFTLLYGLNFDNKQQAEWLISMFVSMAQDVLVSQPIKVILMAVLFALLLKKPQDEDDDVINAELARDEEWLEQNLPHVQTGNAKVADTQCHRPPDKVLLNVARVRLFKERKMHSVIREIVFYFLFVWVVLLIAYAHRDPYAHRMTQNMENLFVGNYDSLGYRDEDKIDVKRSTASQNNDIKLYEVSNVNDFWEWVEQTLVPGLYNNGWYNGKSGRAGFLNDKMSFVVGVARMRQLRVKSGTCKVASAFNVHMPDACDDKYSWDSEDRTPQYAPGWKLTNQNASSYPEYSAWRYRGTTELKSRPFLGHLALYRGGGYKADFGSTIDGAGTVISDLKSNNWVDKYTRAVFVEFTVYNGYSNLYCVANLLLEFTAAGGVVPFIQLLSTRIDRYVGNFLLFVLICEVSFVVFTIIFTYREFKRLLKTDLKEYLTAFWTWIEIALLSLSWTSIALYFIRFALDKFTKKTFRENPNEFVNFHHLALVDQLFGYVYAFVVFMISVKFLRLFRFNRRMSLLGSTLKCAAKELLHFGIIFGLVFVGFSHLCYLVFSHELYKFHTFVTTVETLISVMLGKFSYVTLEKANRVLGPMMFFFYSIGVVFILVNMFLSIIVENFKRVKRNNDLQSNEYEIVDFMTEHFMNWLGLTSRSIFKNRVFSERHLQKPLYKKRKKIDKAAELKDKVDRLVSLIQRVHFDSNDDDFLRNDGEVTYQIPDIKLETYS